MKKYLLMILAVMAFAPALLAQGEKDKAKMKEEIQQFKIDFLAKEMSLSEKEKAEFTSVYREYDNERRKAGSEAWHFERNIKKKKDATEADYKRLTERQQKAREKDNEVVKKYDARFESFLTAKQIYDMHKGEEKFFAKMKEMRKKHGHGPKGHGSKNPPHGRQDGREDSRPGDCPPPPHFDNPDNE